MGLLATAANPFTRSTSKLSAAAATRAASAAGSAISGSSGGVFEVTIDNELIFSKKQTRRFTMPGEVEENVRLAELDIPSSLWTVLE